MQRRLQGCVFFFTNIHLSIAKSNTLFESMFDIVTVVGPYEELQGPILHVENDDINTRLEDQRKSWEATGCTMVFDGWIDGKVVTS
jgi:hypothetical protein